MDIDLKTRIGLPDALRVLLEEFPKEMWESHPNFSGLVSFWLERHMMFRKLTSMLVEDAEQAMDGRLDVDQQKARLSRFGSMFLQQLHGHHHIEDTHYFPKLSGLEPALERGFGILDKDHHAMDGLLDRFAKSANGVIADQVETGVFREEFLGFQAMLLRHLEDEEELIVPVILRHGRSGLE